MRNLMVLGAAALLVVAMAADTNAQCCGTVAPSCGSCNSGCGDCYAGSTQCCNNYGYRQARVRVFARRQQNCCTTSCCPQQACCPQPCHSTCCAQPACGQGYCGTGCCNNGYGNRMMAFRPACNPCGSCGSAMYTGTMMNGCGCHSGTSAGCPGCVQGQVIMEGAPTPAEGTIVEPGTENTPSAPANNNNAAPPTPEDA